VQLENPTNLRKQLWRLATGEFGGTILRTKPEQNSDIEARHLDCAWFYQNEEEIGDAIVDFLKEQGGKVKREDLFICTKVWNHLHEPDEGTYRCDYERT